MKTNVRNVAAGAVALALLAGTVAQAQNPAPASRGSYGVQSTQTFPEGPPALRPDSVANPNSSTNRGGQAAKPRTARKAARDAKRAQRRSKNAATSANVNAVDNSSRMSSSGSTSMYDADAARTGQGARVGNVSAGNVAVGASTTGTPATPGVATPAAAPAPGPNNMRSPSLTVADVIASLPTHKMLINALQTASLADVLKTAGPFTVFAPSDDAFGKLPSTVRSNLLDGANRDALQRLLSYHVVPGTYDADQLKQQIRTGGGQARLQTLTGDALTARLDADGRLTLTDARGQTTRVTLPDQRQQNGIVHGVDGVLMPTGATIR